MKKNISVLQQVLNIWAIVLIVWSIYRTKLQLPEWFDEFIAKPLVFIIPVYWYILRYESKPLLQQVWLTGKNFAGNVYLGLGIGSIFIFSAFFANYVRSGGFDFFGSFLTEAILLAIPITLATAISEEILSRGFILKRLYEDSQNIYSSSFLASILFLVLHITVPGLTGNMLLLFMATDFVLSLVNSFVFLDRKSLVAPILIHALYNLAILFYA